MKKVLITGSKGTIGRILTEGLSDEYELTLADLPESDIRDYGTVLNLVGDKDVVIHLAWNTSSENFQSRNQDPDNSLMYNNVYKACLRKKVKRLIVASSIHADNFQDFAGPGLISVKRRPLPKNPYGRHKVEMENLGMKYGEKGLEVVCIRFGAIGYGAPDKRDNESMSVWLSRKDCINLVKKILEIPKIKTNFLVINAVSDNKTKIHDTSNSLNWDPQDKSEET